MSNPYSVKKRQLLLAPEQIPNSLSDLNLSEDIKNGFAQGTSGTLRYTWLTCRRGDIFRQVNSQCHKNNYELGEIDANFKLNDDDFDLLFRDGEIVPKSIETCDLSLLDNLGAFFGIDFRQNFAEGLAIEGEVGQLEIAQKLYLASRLLSSHTAVILATIHFVNSFENVERFLVADGVDHGVVSSFLREALVDTYPSPIFIDEQEFDELIGWFSRALELLLCGFDLERSNNTRPLRDLIQEYHQVNHYIEENEKIYESIPEHTNDDEIDASEFDASLYEGPNTEQFTTDQYSLRISRLKNEFISAAANIVGIFILVMVVALALFIFILRSIG